MMISLIHTAQKENSKASSIPNINMGMHPSPDRLAQFRPTNLKLCKVQIDTDSEMKRHRGVCVCARACTHQLVLTDAQPGVSDGSGRDVDRTLFSFRSSGCGK